MTQKDNEIKNKTHRIVDRNSKPTTPQQVDMEQKAKVTEVVTREQPTSRRDIFKNIFKKLSF